MPHISPFEAAAPRKRVSTLTTRLLPELAGWAMLLAFIGLFTLIAAVLP